MKTLDVMTLVKEAFEEGRESGLEQNREKYAAMMDLFASSKETLNKVAELAKAYNKPADEQMAAWLDRVFRRCNRSEIALVSISRARTLKEAHKLANDVRDHIDMKYRGEVWIKLADEENKK